jgi:hypothetical protein
MDFSLPLIRVEQFLAVMRTRVGASTTTVLSQSINVWLSYYRYLRMVRGGYSPVAVASIRDNFYPFAQAMLNHLAETFGVFFALSWLRTESSHTHLTAAFLTICVEKNLQGDSAALHAIMHELQTRIIARQTDSRTRSASRFTSGATMTPHENLIDLLACIDQYIMALLDFLEHNLEQSLRQSLPPAAPT